MYSEITDCCCKNLYKAPGENKTKEYFSFITQRFGAVVLQVQLMYVVLVEVSVNCVMVVLGVICTEQWNLHDEMVNRARLEHFSDLLIIM